ncbi:DivIVA domain-containing protein [Hymenobacter armeniacus]|uniref:DivIVA domain-containing protein n=1 Tax=Hymenobacter armeniacus TaxID=2771358 RepID=A0ABR8JW69_9BACT|nr:DivIVA domain-containing protein [Hymenobacter armeniacus]MBD2724207.1 DivIVA domain-containing protein [Hymenobacter armeniacus]
MKITALDIRQKTFEKSFRGVDKDEVQAFLNTISQQWERMGDENRELRLKLEHAQQDVQKMREVESSLYRTLKTAEDTSNNITEQAQRDADLRIREAQFQAETILNDARQRARTIVDEAYQQAEKTVADMQREVGGLGQECQRLEQQLDTLVRDLHHLASDALDKVEKARNRPKGGTAAILSRAARVHVERPKEPAADATPEPTPAMQVTSASSVSSAAAVAAATPAAFAPNARSRSQEQLEQAAQPTGYNPKPGQQPDPGTAPHPDIERPNAPAENPGISPAPNIEQPAPSQVPQPGAPRVEPTAPDIRPVGPDRPEITQPQPMTHPGMAAAAPATAEAPVTAEAAVAEKSFFDEI